MFDLQHLENELSCLDQVPESLLSTIIVDSRSNLLHRVSGLLAWRQALLQGKMPPKALSWPDDALVEPLWDILQELNMPRFTKDNEVLTDRLLADSLAYFQENEAVFWKRYQKELQEIEQAERKKNEEWEQKYQAWKKKKKGKAVRAPKPRTQKELEVEAKRQTLERWKPGTEDFDSYWRPRVRLWSQLSDVFGELGGILGLGWDLSIGVLQHSSWTEIMRLQKLLKALPQLKEIIRALGRLHYIDDSNNITKQIVEKMIRIQEESATVWVPTVPQEARGITRSDEITRMLPSESAMLLHPKLRMVWHARRAERALLTYKFEGEENYTHQIEVSEDIQKDSQEKGKAERGPIIVCLDTSGSMAGTPEVIAKALTLEAMRVAHQETRSCYLYAFSGPQQIIEHELSLAPTGITSLLQFLQTSFSGGTDVDAPVRHALERLKTEDWKFADILLVSDGEFLVPKELQKIVKQAQEQDKVRFFGVQIGNLGKTGLHSLCETVHKFSDWNKVAPLV